MPLERPDALVIGAGVAGLTTAVRLAESGLRVRVLAAEEPGETSSAAAGAIWDPTYANHPRVEPWSLRTLEVFSALALAQAPGIRIVDAVEASRKEILRPGWPHRLLGFRECEPGSLPDGFAGGYQYRAPIIDMPPYLRALSDRVLAMGGEMLFGERLASLDDAFESADVLVNCSGMGARDLVPDPEMLPIRGQVVAVRNPGLREFFAEHTDEAGEMTYLLPHGDLLLLGGSAERGEAEPKPSADIAAAIVERCSLIFPAIAGAEILGHRAGIRPSRPEVRVEHEDLGAGRHVVHNYGHGGSGVSVSWGCAEEVAAMVLKIFRTA